MKKLVKQMEKKKVIYEEKTLLTLKTITQEKTDAVSKAETLQVLTSVSLFKCCSPLQQNVDKTLHF